MELAKDILRVLILCGYDFIIYILFQKGLTHKKREVEMPLSFIHLCFLLCFRAQEICRNRFCKIYLV